MENKQMIAIVAVVAIIAVIGAAFVLTSIRMTSTTPMTREMADPEILVPILLIRIVSHRSSTMRAEKVIPT